MHKDLGNIQMAKELAWRAQRKGKTKYVRIDLVMRQQINVTHKERKSGNTNTKQSRIQGRNIKWDKTGYFIIINHESQEEVIITEPLQPQNNSDRLPQS